jgi:L-histidine N-alpha-methyltransferase
VDVDASVVERSAEELSELYPGLTVHGVVADFGRHLDVLPAGERRLFAFLGGTLGNLYPSERARFLRALAAIMGPSDRLLLGTDLVKDPEVIEAAYNDGAGATAAFNRNMLHNLNTLFDGDFVPDAFEHVATFSPERSRVETRLRASTAQHVRLPGAGLEVHFDGGEELQTEISTKFAAAAIEAELVGAGFALEEMYTDPGGLFAVSLARPL